MSEVASAFVTLRPDGAGFGRSIGREIGPDLDRAGKKAGRSFGGSLVGGMGKAGAAIGAVFAAPAILGGLNSLADRASDLNETVSKSTAIFGKNAGAINKWASGAAQNLGLSKAAALDAAAGFGDMFTQIGFTGKASADMAKSVVQASADLGSFSNLDTADVSDRIAAAFRGEYDSLQAVIPNINAARVESEALAATGKKTAKELTAQEKATAVLAIVQKDGSRAMGDFARTSDGAANKAKIQAARFEDLKTKAGGVLLPIKSLALDGFGALITFGEKLGPVFTRIGSSFTPIINTAKVFIGAFTGAGADVEVPWMNTVIDFGARFRVTFDQVVGFIRAQIMPAFAGIVAAVRQFVSVALPIVQQFVAGMQARIAPLMPQVRAVFSQIGQIVVQVMGLIKTMITATTAVIAVVWKRWGSQIMNVVTAAFKAVIAIVSGALRVVSGVVKLVTSLIKGDWSGAWAAIKQIVSGAWQVIKTVVGAAISVVRSVVSAGLNALKGIASSAWGGVKSAVSAGVSNVVELVKSLPGKIVSALGDLGGLLRDAGAKLIQGLADGILGRIRSVTDAAGKVASAIKGFFPGSPVKEGPLTSWNNGGAGKRLGGMLADGLAASRSQVAAASRSLASGVVVGGSYGGATGGAAGGRHITIQGNVGWSPTDLDRAIDERERRQDALMPAWGG